MHIDTNYSLPSPLIHKLHRARWLNPMHMILITFFWICDMWWCVNKWASQAEEILFHCVHPEMLKTTIIQDVTHIIPNNIKQYQNTCIYIYVSKPIAKQVYQHGPTNAAKLPTTKTPKNVVTHSFFISAGLWTRKTCHGTMLWNRLRHYASMMFSLLTIYCKQPFKQETMILHLA